MRQGDRRATPLTNLPLKNAVLISNPLAGLQDSRHSRRLHKAGVILHQAGINAKLQFTTRRGDAERLAREAAGQGCDLIIVCGGDGTINEVVNGMAPVRIPLAILPGGTANIVARELGLPGGILKAARMLPSWRPCRIPLGRAIWEESGSARQRYFLAVAGIGFDAHIIQQLNVAMKLRLGVIAYGWEAVRQVFRYAFPRFQCEANGVSSFATFAVIQRSRRYAGWLKLARPHSVHDHGFSCCLFEGSSPARYFRYAISVLTQTHHRMKDVRFLNGPSVRCIPTPDEQVVFFEVDGEMAGKLPVTFESVPDAMTILAPEPFFSPKA